MLHRKWLTDSASDFSRCVPRSTSRPYKTFQVKHRHVLFTRSGTYLRHVWWMPPTLDRCDWLCWTCQMHINTITSQYPYQRHPVVRQIELAISLHLLNLLASRVSHKWNTDIQRSTSEADCLSMESSNLSEGKQILTDPIVTDIASTVIASGCTRVASAKLAGITGFSWLTQRSTSTPRGNCRRTMKTNATNFEGQWVSIHHVQEAKNPTHIVCIRFD